MVIWLAESLVQRGHEVVLFTREFSEAAWGEIKSRPYKIHLLDFRKHRSTLKTNREAGVALQKALFAYKFDIINPHNYPASLWVYYARQQQGEFPPVLMYMEEPPRNFYEKVTDQHFRRLPGLRNLWGRYRPKKLFRHFRQLFFGYRKLDKAAVLTCNKVLANSKYTASMASKIYNRDVIPCPLGIPTERFHKLQLANLPVGNTQRQSPFILTVARIELAKNFDTIVKAAKILKKKSILPRGFKYKIAGKGPYLDYFRKKCRRMGIDDIVEFLGFIPDEDLSTFYLNSLFFVYIALDDPFGLVPLEAALFRKPSIVSDHGGHLENVIEGMTGLHADALNPADVAEKIQCLLNQPEKVAKMGANAYSWVKENKTWTIFMDKFEGHLNQTVANFDANDAKNR